MFNKSYDVAATERANKELSNSFTKYTIKLLDNSTEIFNLSIHARGMNLLDTVCDSLELLERDYFGIHYRCENVHDGSVFMKWLKMDKFMRKQIKGDIESMTFFLRVRFVPLDIYQMQETYTRYQLFLQIKQDIHANKINCSKEITVQLSGYALQSELGDYNSTTLKPGYVGEFRFISDQTSSFEAEVANFHKTLRGIRPEEAEMKFLTTAKQLSQYGCDLFSCELMEKSIQFGFHAIGISLFPSQAVGGPFIVPWNALDKVLHRNKSFIIKVILGQPIFSLLDGGTSHSIQAAKKANLAVYDYEKTGFKLTFTTKAEAKEAWKSSIENHSFFRVRDPKQIQGSVLLKRSRSLFKFAKVRTLFTGRRTLPELVEIKRRNRTMERSFIRTSSKRFAKKHPGLGEKQYGNSVPEPIRQTGVSQAKNHRSSITTTGNNSKDTIKTDKKKEHEDSEHESSENDIVDHEPCDFRPKSTITQSARLNKGNQLKEFPRVHSAAHSSMPRKSRNIYTKSLSMDDDRKPLDINGNEDTLKATNHGEKTNKPRPYSSIIETKTQTISKSHLKPKQNGSKAGLSNSTGDKLMEPDSSVDITIKPLDGKYGFTVRGGADTGKPVIVTRISVGSPADASVPNLSEGDQIIKINNMLADELTHDEIKEIIRSTGQRKDNQLVLTVKSRLYIADDSMSSDEIVTEFNYTSPPGSLQRTVTNDLRTQIKLLDESLKNGSAMIEFEKLYKQHQGLSMNESKKVDNINKNRYRDILPYDQTRIVLRNGCYINANLIKFDLPKSSNSLKYIATQGPLMNTANDFFAMVWENQCQLIVMLTDVQERGRSKCFKYWPDAEEVMKLNDGVQITCESETMHNTYVIRELKIKKANDARKCVQLHYIGWPDHGVPQRIEDFISFMRLMRQMRQNRSEPVLVHCSAGIGRTGVLITMDIAMSCIEIKQQFTVLSIVKEIRNQRAMLVQSQKQYDFVCRAIVNYFTSNYSK